MEQTKTSYIVRVKLPQDFEEIGKTENGFFWDLEREFSHLDDYGLLRLQTANPNIKVYEKTTVSTFREIDTEKERAIRRENAKQRRIIKMTHKKEVQN